MVLAIFIIVTKLSTEDSQRTILPVCPESVNVPPLLPVHTEASEVTAPGTVGFVTVIVTEEEFASRQVPSFTTARYLVLWVKFK